MELSQQNMIHNTSGWRPLSKEEPEGNDSQCVAASSHRGDSDTHTEECNGGLRSSRTMRQNGDSQEVCMTSSEAQISIEVSKHKQLTIESPELSLGIKYGQDDNRQEEKGGSEDRKQAGQGSGSQQTKEPEQQRACTVNLAQLEY